MDSQPLPDWIEQVLCGALPADDADFLRALERDPALRERWERVSALASRLDAMGAAEREVLGEDSAAAPAEEERVAELVRHHFEPRAKRRPGRGWLAGALLAAGLALTLWWLTDTDPGAAAGPDPDPLGSLVLSGDDGVLSDLSAVDGGDGTWRLEWADAQQTFGRTWFVRIHARDGAAVGATLEALGSEELMTPCWTFTLPPGYDAEHLAWSVEARDADRSVVATSAVRPLGSR